jgi:hypothetical protein
MTIYLDLDEAEFWQHYESVNESVIATARAAARYGDRFRPSKLPAAVRSCVEPLACAPPQREGDSSCGPTDFGS